MAVKGLRKETQNSIFEFKNNNFNFFKETRVSIFRLLGHVLSGHAISTHQVYSLPDCHTLCVRHPRCLSYNYQASSMSSSHFCEINDATGKLCPNDMIETKGFHFYEDEVNYCTNILFPRGEDSHKKKRTSCSLESLKRTSKRYQDPIW